MFPEECTADEIEEDAALVRMKQEHWQHVSAQKLGYIQTTDLTSLSDIARQHGVIIRMESGVGEFVGPCMPLLSFSGAKNKEIAPETFGACYVIDTYRTIEQDPAFGIRQLVDIALKALSPGINDTTTAGTCVEHLTAILILLVQRQIPIELRGKDNELLVMIKNPSFAKFVALSFNQILENAANNTEILSKLVDSITRIASANKLKKRAEILEQWLATIEEVALRCPASTYAASKITKHIELAKSALAAPTNAGRAAL